MPLLALDPTCPGGESWTLASWLFLRLLGLSYFAAFASLAVQIKGLIGRNGILPAAEFLASGRRWGLRRFLRVPTLCWFSASDAMLASLCWGGAVLAVMLMLGVTPMPLLLLLWLFYLSLFHVGQIFLCYQWDLLLLEAGCLAIFLAPWELVSVFPSAATPPRLVLWLLWWLLFRLMFGSGWVKLRSGDPAWRSLTALRHHFETQPLPTRLGWFAHQLPGGWLKLAALIMFAVELLAPFLILAPSPWRHAAAVAFICLMLLIQLTGNYGFFNLLGIALAVLLLDDRVLAPVYEWVTGRSVVPAQPGLMPGSAQWSLIALATLVLPLSAERVLGFFRLRLRWPGVLARVFDVLEPFHLVNGYGLFAVMTRSRPEISLEGSADGVTWREYEFKWKPGDPKRPPRIVAPHLPRLDWQMWFAAQEPLTRLVWFEWFLARLKTGSPAVLSLLRRNPFPEAPPRRIRTQVHDYRFTANAERRRTGDWWQSKWRGAGAENGKRN